MTFSSMLSLTDEPLAAGFVCAVCGAEEVAEHVVAVDHRYGNAGTFDYLRCARCGVLSQHPVPDESTCASYYPDDETYYAYGDLTPSWPSGLAGEGLSRAVRARGYRMPSQRGGLLPALAGLYYRVRGLRDIPRAEMGTRFLDFGSGARGMVARMEQLGWTASGLDPSPDAVANG